jgi:lipopolysaccharide transport system permease protein
MKETGIIIYAPNNKQKVNFFMTWVVMFNNIVRSRELIWQLFKRDFFATYKKSFLGFTWLLISPIIGIVSWIFLNSAGVLQPGDVGIPFPAYVLIGTSLWGLFMGFYSSSSGTLGAGSGFILQVKYPHEALLVKQVAGHLANFTITFVLNLAVLVGFGIIPDWRVIFFPILMLPMFFLGAGLGLILSVVSVVASDITNFVNIGLSFVFYATPIIYKRGTLGEPFNTLVEYNPLTYLVGGMRDIIISGEISNPDRFLYVSIASFIFFLIAWRLFYVSEDKVIEKLL